MSTPLHHQLDDLKQRFARMAARVLQTVERSVEATFEGDEPLVAKVRKADGRIDAEEVEVEKAAIDLLALYQPAAVDLRTITTIIKANSDLERIGDCAVNVATAARPLIEARGDDAQLEAELPPGLRELADLVLDQVAATIRAFNLADAAAARDVLHGEQRVDAVYAAVLQSILEQIPADARRRADDESENEDQVRQDIAAMMIAKNLERIGDHCTNIAEDVVYIATGRIIRHGSDEF